MDEETYRLCSFVAQCCQVLFTLLVAIVGAYIAYLQFRLARDKRRYELYERRLRVFRAATEFLHHLHNDGAISNELLAKFVTNSAEVDFLFQSDAEGVIKSLVALGFRQVAGNDQNPEGISSEEFFEYSEAIRNVFTSYLNLKEK